MGAEQTVGTLGLRRRHAHRVRLVQRRFDVRLQALELGVQQVAEPGMIRRIGIERQAPENLFQTGAPGVDLSLHLRSRGDAADRGARFEGFLHPIAERLDIGGEGL